MFMHTCKKVLFNYLSPKWNLTRVVSRLSSNDDAQVTITDRCLNRINQVLESDELLRVGVRGGGCSGFEYEFSVEKRSSFDKDKDLLFENHVVIDQISMEYLSGSKVDFEDELIRSGFYIKDNPLADKNCSCGVSFSLKTNDEKFSFDKESN